MVGLIGSLRGSSYKIPNSLRFRSSNSSYLSRTPTFGGNQKTWTWSGWVKRGSLGTTQSLFEAGTVKDQTNTEILFCGTSMSTGGPDTLSLQGWSQLSSPVAITNAVFRDTSAWYHIVVAFDSTNATASERMILYVNGVRQTLVHYIAPTLNLSWGVNNNWIHTIGKLSTDSLYHFDGYMAEVNFIDGQALAPSSFGKISGSTGVWSPKKYTGTYGTNGFYLNFKDNSAATSAAIGKDYSGNYNNWTPNNISLIAGTSYDSMVDSPTPYGDSLQYFTGTRYPYNALQFIASKGSYLNRTPTVAGNRQTWTWSGWIKRGIVNTLQHISYVGSSNTYFNQFYFDVDNTIGFHERISGGNGSHGLIKTTNTFSDTSTWYHVVFVWDTTQASQENRIKLYVNNVLQSVVWTTYPGLNYEGWRNTIVNTLIGVGATGYFDGYLADINFIDGQALNPSSFGETVNGVWKPKTYSGTYGTNGFYLKFNDNSAATATALGKDSAGSNNWTPTNLAVTDVTSTDITSVKLVNPNYGLQFRSAASTYLSKTLPTSDNKKWTWSSWVKRSATGGIKPNALFSNVVVAGSSEDFIAFFTDNTLAYHDGNAGITQTKTTNAFTDTSTWYHVVYVYDSAQTVQADRGKFYVNGVLQQASDNNISLSRQSHINTTSVGHAIGGYAQVFTGNTGYLDGYLAEVNFIDGQALTPSSFGETIDGAWVPKSYTGTYGTNGFYLNFADRSAMTDTAIGNDASSNNNNWTPNNLVISDAIDYTAKTARGNYATLNPLSIVGGSVSLAAGNTLVTVPNSSNQGAMATMVCNGKNYFETQGNAFGSNVIAICCTAINFSTGTNSDGVTYNSDGRLYINGVQTTVPTYTSADVIGVTVDTSTREIKFFKNNVQIGTTAIAAGTGDLIFGVVGSYLGTGSGSTYVNFGQRPFVYTPPAGFKALNTYNLPAPAISNAASYMAATTYTGTGAALSVNNITNNKTFKPDLVWIKSRSAATNHALYDSLRGVQKDLVSNSTAAETTQTAGLLAFNDNGFNIGTLPKLNTNAATYVAWQWKAGESTVANTAGTIASQVNAGVDQGFSVVSYTGTGVNATVGHGLGAVPKMIIVKNRSTINNWEVYHDNLPSAATTIQLSNADAYNTVTAAFNSTDPTTSVFSVGTSITTNGAAQSLVAYCFSEVAGYSKFGSYTGNGSNDGPFVYCGFRPRWIMLKNTVEALGNWMIYDTSRDTHNLSKCKVGANTNLNENESMVILGDSTWGIDILSNGFKIRIYSGPNHNTASVVYIFAAFAETPFKYSLAR